MKRNLKGIVALILWTLFSVTLIACGSGGGGGGGGDKGNSTGTSNSNSVDTSDITPILGKWETTTSNCTETVEFYTDKTFKSSSHLELHTGTYELTKKNSNEYTVSIKILNDNGALDCDELLNGGNAENDTGSQGSLDVTITDTQLTIINSGISYSYIVPILGAWDFTGSNCTETIEFFNDKTFMGTSYLEIQTGTYDLTKNSGKYTLLMNIQNDNGALDCDEFTSGSTAENDTGSQITMDVAITDGQLSFSNVR